MWISECLTRGFALHRAQDFGQSFQTLFTDEADRPLDLERKRAFMKMKREVLRRGGLSRSSLFRKCLGLGRSYRAACATTSITASASSVVLSVSDASTWCCKSADRAAHLLRVLAGEFVAKVLKLAPGESVHVAQVRRPCRGCRAAYGRLIPLCEGDRVGLLFSKLEVEGLVRQTFLSWNHVKDLHFRG